MTETKSLELPRIGRREPVDGAAAVRRRGRDRVLAVAVAAVVLLGVAVWLAVLSSRATSLQDAREEAVASARTRVPTLLSYQHADLEADLDAALATTTGDFRADYEQILDEVVAPTAAQKRIDTAADVTAVGVVEASRDRVVVLAFVTQTTVAAGSSPSVTGSRIEVTLVPVDGEWLISGLEPV